MQSDSSVVVRVAKENREAFRPDFLAWLIANVHVFAEFERRAVEVSRFRRHYSARTIVEVMRHETAIGQLSGEFKINDWFTPSMARLFVQMYPQHKNLFELRKIKAKQDQMAAA